MEEATKGKIAKKIDLDCSAEQIWEGFLHAHELDPKILPSNFEAIEFIKGDYNSVGSIRKVVFVEAIPGVKEVIERIDIIDHENKKIRYTVIDGDFGKFFKMFVVTIKIVAMGDGCSLTLSLEYEKVNEESPSPHVFVERMTNGLQDLCAYLLRNKFGSTMRWSSITLME